MDILNFLLEPLSYPFIQRALIMASAIALVCAMLSCFLVLKGWALMGDAISHAVLPGIVLAYMLAIPLTLGAFIAGILSTTLIGYIERKSRLKEDTVIGIVFSGMFAAGLLLFTLVKTDLHLMHILFGDILGVQADSMRLDLLLLLLVAVIILFKRTDLMLFCFDQMHVGIIGQSSRKLHFMLLSMLALVIVFAIQAVGVLLVVAMLISPGMFGYLLAKRFGRMMWIAIFYAQITVLFGVLGSFYLDVATAPFIVVLQALVFIPLLFIKKYIR